MDATYSPRRPARQASRRRRAGRILLVAVGLVTALLASGCDTAQQVPWATYSSQLQPRIDAATATGNCAALQLFLSAAETTSRAGAEHGLAPIRHLRQPGVGKTGIGKSAQHPLRRAGAFFRRELAGVSHRPDGHELRQLGPHLTLSLIHI